MVFLWVIGILVVVHLVLRLMPARPERDLRGKVVLLTGAGGGLGRLMTLELARRGCRLALVDVAPKPNEETLRLAQQQQPRHLEQPSAKTYTVDLSKREEIQSLVRQVIQDFGCIDILVGNAGQLQAGAVWELSADQTDLVLDVNLRANIHLVREVVPHMKERRSGHLVAISSMSALCSARQISVYATTKAALTQFMECTFYDLEFEGFSNDIHVTTIHPWFMNTYGLLTETIQFTGFLGRTLLRFMDPERPAKRIVRSIARREDVVNIPSRMGYLLSIMRIMPRHFNAFMSRHVVAIDQKPTLAYQDFRHNDLDGRMLHELLAKGYPLVNDPDPVCRNLNDDYLVQGKSLPHDFTRYAKTVEQFYAQRGQGIPPAVRCVFGFASS